MSDKMKEEVICLPASVIDKVYLLDHPYFDWYGWGPPKDRARPCFAFLPASVLSFHDLDKVFLKHMLIKTRGECEEDPTLRHFATYCVVTALPTADSKDRLIFTYRRGKSGTESRLHGQLSIGVGGHVNPTGDGIQSSLRYACDQELKEELGVGSNRYPGGSLSYKGLLIDSSTPVNKVHIGAVFEYKSDGPIWPVEDCLARPSYSPLSLLSSLRYGVLEAWSQTLISGVMKEPGEGSAFE